MIYLRLIWSYLKIGFFGFGGGYVGSRFVGSRLGVGADIDACRENKSESGADAFCAFE